MFYTVPTFIQRVFPKLLWRYAQADRVYLTFDDGPVPEATPYVLDQLQKYNAKATFFCVGENVKRHPAIYQRILDEGHRVGNHTHRHLHAWKVPSSEYMSDIAMAATYIDSNLFRPPYGKMRPGQSASIDKTYEIVMWDILSGDYNPKLSADHIINHVVKHSKSGSIVVFHDSVKVIEKLKQVLPHVLQHYQDQEWIMDHLPYKAIAE